MTICCSVCRSLFHETRIRVGQLFISQAAREGAGLKREGCAERRRDTVNATVTKGDPAVRDDSHLSSFFPSCSFTCFVTSNEGQEKEDEKEKISSLFVMKQSSRHRAASPYLSRPATSVGMLLRFSIIFGVMAVFSSILCFVFFSSQSFF